MTNRRATVGTAVADLPVQDLRASLRGEVLQPRDEGYEAARKVWNGMVDKRPALIARSTGTADVIEAVRFARANDLAVAVRGGGHNVAGFGTCDGGMVIDLSSMKGMRVDPESRTARAQPGLTWGDFDHETQAFGLATTGGLVSTTGIAGFTLGGGIGWLMRKHGLTIDNLISADVVTADGRLLRASADENADLLWGLRGGGGNFGIVTSFEYRLHPVGPVVLGGAIFHPLDRAGDFLRFYDQWAPTLPDELTTLVVFLTAPPEPFIPQHLQGTQMVAVALCYAGPVEEGQKALRPLREFAPPAVDLVGPIPYTALQGMFDASAPAGMRGFWKTEYLAELSSRAIEALLDHAAKMRSLFPLSVVHIHHLEGAVNRAGSEGTAFGQRSSSYALNIIGLWNDPAQDDAHVAWARKFWSAMQPFSGGGAYVNFLGDEGEDRVRAAYGAPKYERLVALKNKYDPTNFFRMNQNIKPTV